MCNFIRRLPNVKVCGRSVYRTDRGLKLGWTGPQIDLDAFVSDLSPSMADAVREAVRVHDEDRDAKQKADALDRAEVGAAFDDPALAHQLPEPEWSAEDVLRNEG